MILPFTNNPAEVFNFNINGIIYKFAQKWNTLGFWTLDILDVDGIPFIHGLKLVVGTDLLANFENLPFGLKSTNLTDPSRDTLSTFNLEVLI
jgi:hypothetical protein